jgi:3-phenylpropionate/cinnamic acid dioxygenase small subunit
MSAPEQTRAPLVAVDPARLAQLAAFLYLEGELLDERRFAEWLALYADDATYWIPQGPDADPRTDVQLVHDDRRRIGERVLRLSGGHAYSQDPPSRTLHLISNVRLVADAGESLVVASAQLVTELRRGRQAAYAAHVRHELVARDDGGWLVRRKEIRMLNSDIPLGNVTFLM